MSDTGGHAKVKGAAGSKERGGHRKGQTEVETHRYRQRRVGPSWL